MDARFTRTTGPWSGPPGGLVFAALALAALAAWGGVTHHSRYVVAGLFGAPVFYAIMRSRVRLPLVMIFLFLLAADSNHPYLVRYGKLLRWCALGIIAFKEISFWSFSREIRMRLTPAHVAFLLFALYAMMSSVYSVDTSLTFQRGFSVLLFFGVVFIHFWRLFADPEARRLAVRGLSMLAPVLYMAAVVYGAVYGRQAWYGARFRGFSGNPNGLGLMIMFTAPILLWRFLTDRSPRIRGLCLIFLMLGMGLLAVSASRAALMGTAIACFVLLLRLRPQNLVIYGILLALVTFIIEVRGVSSGESRSLEEARSVFVRDTEPSLGGREEAWRKAVTLGSRRFYWGHGFGTAVETFGRLDFEEHYGGYPHNFLLHMFVDLGIIGMLMVVALHLVLMACAFRTLAPPRGAPAPHDTGLGALAAGLYLAGVANATFESWMFSIGAPGVFPFWIMAMVMLREYLDIFSPGPDYGFGPMERRRRPRYGGLRSILWRVVRKGASRSGVGA